MTEQSSIRHCLALALWQTAKAAPAPTMFALASGKRQEFLNALIQDAAKLNDHHDEEFNVSNIEIQLRRVADRPTAMIQLPPPFQCPEPRIIALVFDKKVRGDVRKSGLEGGTIDFFTLEEPPEGANRPPSMLCSRDTDGAHHNYGGGPFPSSDAFCDRLSQIYGSKPWWKFW